MGKSNLMNIEITIKLIMFILQIADARSKLLKSPFFPILTLFRINRLIR